MSQVANRPNTFEEFASLNIDGRFELVYGQMEVLVAGEFGFEDNLTSELIPGLAIPMRRLFW